MQTYKARIVEIERKEKDRLWIVVDSQLSFDAKVVEQTGERIVFEATKSDLRVEAYKGGLFL